MALARLVWAALTHGGAGASGSLAAATSFAHGSTMGTVSSASSAASLLRGALAHRAPLCTQPPNELLLQRLASSSSSSSAACSSSASAAAVAVGRTLLRHAAPLPVPGSAALRQPHAGKRGFGSTAGGSSAGAGGSGSGGAAPRNILEHAAEAQMQKLKTKPDPAHHHQQQEPPGVVSRVLGVLVDAAALGVGGFLLFSGYYTLTHPDIADLDVALSNAHKSLELAAGGGSGGAPAPAAAPAPPSSAPAGKTSSVVLPPPPSAVEPAAFPPLTQAWCAVMDRRVHPAVCWGRRGGRSVRSQVRVRADRWLAAWHRARGGAVVAAGTLGYGGTWRRASATSGTPRTTSCCQTWRPSSRAGEALFHDRAGSGAGREGAE